MVDVPVLAAPDELAVAIELREARAFGEGAIVVERDDQAAVLQQLRADPFEARGIGLADVMLGGVTPQLIEIGFPVG